MAYAVAYMRSILGSIPFLVMLYIFSLSVSFFGSPAPRPNPAAYLMLMTLSSVPREVFATLFFSNIVNIETAEEIRTTGCYKITFFILLHEKFLQFDWLRAVVFQLNLKYLHVKITTLLWVVVYKNDSTICT